MASKRVKRLVEKAVKSVKAGGTVVVKGRKFSAGKNLGLRDKVRRYYV